MSDVPRSGRPSASCVRRPNSSPSAGLLSQNREALAPRLAWGGRRAEGREQGRARGPCSHVPERAGSRGSR